MPEQKKQARHPPARAVTQSTPMEKPEPMNRYISSAVLTSPLSSCCDPCLSRQNQVLLEQLVELSVQQNQLLIDLLGAVNSLTAALLTARAQV